MQAHGGTAFRALLQRLAAASRACLEVVDFKCTSAGSNPKVVFAGAVLYLTLGGTLIVGWQWSRALLAAERQLAAGEDVEFMRAKVATAAVYADHLLTRAAGLRDAVVAGSEGVARFPAVAF